MKLGDMLTTLRTAQYERVEIRDAEGTEIFTCPSLSDAVKQYLECEVTEWFPHGAPNKDATFTVCIRR